MMYLAAVLLLASTACIDVMAQSGEEDNLKSISFTGKVRLLKETFTSELNNPQSQVYMSLKDSFEDELVGEIKSELQKKRYPFAKVTAEVKNFTSGSVNVVFILVIDGTSMTVGQLLEAARSATEDSTIGKFSSSQIEDLNECQETSTECSEFAKCVNTVGSFICNCSAEYFDQSDNGTICVTPVSVNCESDKMEMRLKYKYAKSLSIRLSDLRLQNESCAGFLNSTSNEYEFAITKDLASCGSIRKDNTTHVTYSNVLSNKPKSTAIIMTGSELSIPFSCSYPKNITTSMSFEGEVSSINISSTAGEGKFFVDLKMYKSSSFEVEEKKREFKTSDTLYLRAELNSKDTILAVVLDRCWATPTSTINDSIHYDIIKDGCKDASAVRGTVNVFSNGGIGKSSFSVQVFKFVDASTTYIHCRIVVCSTADGNSCRPTCDSRRRRSIYSDYSYVSLYRQRRETSEETKVHNKTVGPLYRVEDEIIDVRFWAVTMSLVFLLVVSLCIIACLAIKRNAAPMKSVVGLKIQSLGEDNFGYE
uniref:ZP domain-containing protein-like n=1 Tax=Styela clava TaxID=7725 RepID=UPI00193A03E3|nr:ZP domain-containing protein-like [Styela clava]